MEQHHTQECNPQQSRDAVAHTLNVLSCILMPLSRHQLKEINPSEGSSANTCRYNCKPASLQPPWAHTVPLAARPCVRNATHTYPGCTANRVCCAAQKGHACTPARRTGWTGASALPSCHAPHSCRQVVRHTQLKRLHSVCRLSLCVAQGRFKQHWYCSTPSTSPTCTSEVCNKQAQGWGNPTHSPTAAVLTPGLCIRAQPLLDLR